MYEKKPWLKSYNGIPETINYPRVTMYEAVMQTVERYPDYVAYDCMDYTATYQQFSEQIDQLANALFGIGVRQGDVFTIAMPTCPQAVICFYAANKLGVVVSMIHPLSTAKEIAYYLGITSSRFALTMTEHYKKFKQVQSETRLETLILTELTDFLNLPTTTGQQTHPDPMVFSWTDLMTASHPEAPRGNMDTGEMAAILYSGGTTGFPKGIMLSNANFISQGMMTASLRGIPPEAYAILVILPVFHGYGLGVCCNATFMLGGKAILVPNFKPDTFARLIQTKRPSVITGVPTLYDALSRNAQFQKADLGCLRSAGCGADTLPRTVKERFEKIVQPFGNNVRLLEGYGLTEAVTGIMGTPADGYRENSVGIPYPDMMAKVVKIGTTEEAPVGEEGELCVSGPAVMLGYLGQPEETAATLKMHPDGRTWLHTGDIFTMDEDGYFYYKLRLKRMIKSSGMNVYPMQVEEVLRQHPAVQSACVIGIPDEAQVERVKAFVVLKDPSVSDPSAKEQSAAHQAATHRDIADPDMADALITHCREHLIKWSCPREIAFRDSLPLTRVGKIACAELEKEELARLKAEGKYTGGK